MSHDVGQLREHTQKMPVEEMCMLRWMYGKICNDRIRNERIIGYLGISPLMNKIRETTNTI